MNNWRNISASFFNKGAFCTYLSSVSSPYPGGIFDPIHTPTQKVSGTFYCYYKYFVVAVIRCVIVSHRYMVSVTLM